MHCVVINGAGGNTGKTLTDHCFKRKDKLKIRAVVRNEEEKKIFEKKGEGLEVVVTDWNDHDKLRRAQEGADSVWITPPSPTKEHGPFDRIEITKKVVDAAKEAGVKHILLGSIGVTDLESLQDITLVKEFKEIEKYVKDSGIPWTIFGMGMFVENLKAMKNKLDEGVYCKPLGKGKFAPVALCDIGEAAACVFEDPTKFYGKKFILHGPQLMDGQEQAAAIGKGLGKEIKFQDIDKREAAEMLKTCLPEFEVEGMLKLFEHFQTKEHLEHKPFEDLKELLGKEPTTLEERVRQLHQRGVL